MFYLRAEQCYLSIFNFLAGKPHETLTHLFFSFLITDHSVLYCSTVLYSLSTYFTLFLTRINFYASEDRNSQPRKSLHTLRQSINQMYQNLALKLQCKHFRLFKEFLYQLRQYSFEKKKKIYFRIPDFSVNAIML